MERAWIGAIVKPGRCGKRSSVKAERVKGSLFIFVEDCQDTYNVSHVVHDNPNMYIAMNPSTSGPSPSIGVLLMVAYHGFSRILVPLKVVVCRSTNSNNERLSTNAEKP